MNNVTLIKHSPKARQLFDYRKEVAINKTYGFFLGYNLCGFKRGIISNNGQMHELMYLSLSPRNGTIRYSSGTHLSMVVLSPFKRVPTRSGYRTYSCTTSKKSSNNIRTHTGQANPFILSPLQTLRKGKEGKAKRKETSSLFPSPTHLCNLLSPNP